MRAGDIVAAVVVVIVAAIVLLLWLPVAGCACTPSMDEPAEPWPPSAVTGARLVANAQARRYAQVQAFAGREALAPGVTLPPGIVLEELRATRTSYVARVVEREGARRSCVVAGRAPAADGQHRFTLDCREPGPAPPGR